MSILKTGLEIHSKVTLDLFVGDKKIRKTYKNLIVNGGYNVLSRLLFSTDTNFDEIAYIGVGTGGHAPGDIYTPIPPLVTDTSLEVEISRSDISQKNQTSTNVIEYRCLFDNETANEDLTEAGLFTLDGTLFARVTFSAVHKESPWFLIVTWEYTLSEGS